MTAIAVMPCDDGFVIASDGAVCIADSGEMIGLTSKLMLMPEWSCALVGRGFAGMVANLYRYVGLRRDFDDLLGVIGPASRELHAHYVLEYSAECHWSFVLLGWSAARSRFAMYFLRSREYHIPIVGGAPETIAPYHLHEALSLYAAPMPNPELCQKFGIDLTKAQDTDPVILTCKLVAAARFARDAEFSKSDTCIIGGFIQSTILKQHEASTRIVHRWPDRIGEKIDPMQGEAMPAFLKLEPIAEGNKGT